MRVVLFLILALSVFGSGHPLNRRQGQQVNRVLVGKFERQWKRKGGNIMEMVAGTAGIALGTAASAAFGSVTGGNLGTKAGRSGLGMTVRMTCELVGGVCGSKAGAFAGRQADKLTKAGRAAQAADKNKKREQAEALKKPVLYTGGQYQKAKRDQAKLGRTGSSGGLLQRNNASPGGGRRPLTHGASPSAGKPSPSGSQSPRHGASTSGTQLNLHLGLRKRKL